MPQARVNATRAQMQGTDKMMNSPMEDKKWIQGAIKKPGALHKQLGVPADKKIPAKELKAAAKKSGKLGQRARLAKKLKSYND